jgi:Tfp pilus assembly protein PilN
MDNLRESLGGLSGLLPVLLLLMVILGDLMFFATGVFPAMQDYNALNEQLAAANVALSQQSVEQIEDDPIGILNSQIQRLQAQIDETATVFLTDNQGDSILDRLYAYSDESGVDITNLQLQQSPTATEDGPSSVRQFRLQVAGPVARLVNYIMRIRGAVLPTLQLTNLSITETDGQGLLTMDVAIYVSSYSDGAAMDNLPPVDVPAPPMPTATPVPAEPTPADATPVAEGASDVLPVVADAGMIIDTLAGESTTPSAADCPGAPLPWFQVGDTVVVDFNGLGALRILDQVGGGAYQTLRQAYDNQVLTLLDGPACGPWREGNIWYWYTEVDGVRGWAGEASASVRWMCPQDDPECA